MNFANDDERKAYLRKLIKRNSTLGEARRKAKIARKVALKERNKDNGLPAYAKDNSSANINYYTDQRKYADRYYGETMRETTKLDDKYKNELAADLFDTIEE
tara:strand:- start:453 stop:758 length:306 start_codon:yes stop_codon:yes gene_type:complete